MSFNVTTKMANEFWGDLAIAKSREGSNLLRDYQETIQKFIDQHKLAPASAVEEVELTDREWLGLWVTIGQANDNKPAQAGKNYFASRGIRIVRDVNTVAADDAAKHDEMDVVIEKLTSRINALEINQGDAKKMNAELMKRVDKVGTDCQAVKAVVTRAENRAIQIKNRVEALEASNSEPETKAAERTFTEAEVRAAIDYADRHSMTAEMFVDLIWKRLGIDPESSKQAEHDDN